MPTAKRSMLIRRLTRAGLLLSLWLLPLLLPRTALAETAILEINYLPLQEAESIVKTRLSPSGTVAAMPSRRILVVTDHSPNIAQARSLLRQLDVEARQYRTTLELFSLDKEQARSLQTSVRLPGGWIRARMKNSSYRSTNRKQFTLQLTSSREGSVESGTIRPYHQHTRQWLAGYGVIHAHSVELVPITSGFHATVHPAGEGMVHVRIVPWMKSLRDEPAAEGETEVLIDLGDTGNPKRQPDRQASVRLNANPTPNPIDQQSGVIEIAGAATEVTIPLGETITIATNSSEAEMLGDALLSTGTTIGKKSFAIQLRVNSH